MLKSGSINCIKIVDVGLFYSLSVETLKSGYFYRLKNK